MKLYQKTFISLFLVLSILINTSCSVINPAHSTSKAFANLCNNYFIEEAASSSLNLHYTLSNPENYGINSFPITYGSLDESSINAYSQKIESMLQALSSVDYEKLDLSQQLTFDILKEHLTLEADNSHFTYYSELLSPVCGTQAQLPILLSEYSLSCEQDIIEYLSLLSITDKYFAEILDFEKRKASMGLFMPDFAVDDIVAQCEDFINSEDNFLIETFNERIQNINDLSKQAKQNYIMQNKSMVENHVYHAYRLLINGLKELKGHGRNEKGLAYFPNGKAYYEYLVKSSTGSYRPIEDILDMVLQKLQKDLTDMSKIVSENPYVLAMTDTYSFSPKSPENILNELVIKTADDFPKISSCDFKVKYVHPSLSKHISPAFYLIPTIDSFNKNTIYINPSSNYEKLNLYTTLAHEGFPGHLYQTVYFYSASPQPIRHVLGCGGYTEGWATYVEMYSYKYADVNEQLSKLLQLNNSITLGIYALLDIQIHYNGHDRAKTFEFLKKLGFDNEKNAHDIYNIIIEEPANYLKYYVGYLEFLELKKLSQTILKDNYSDKKFHQAVLEIGPCSFKILNKYLPVYLKLVTVQPPIHSQSRT